MSLFDKNLYVVGIIGHMNAGKSTAAKFFTDKGFIEVGFSHAMKEAMDIIGLPRTRENMQKFGTIMRERWSQDIWVKALEHRIEPWISLDETFFERRNQHAIPGFVIPDVRFINELHWIREQRGYSLGLVCPLEVMYARALGRPDRDPPESYESFLTSLEHHSEKHISYLLGGCSWQLQSDHNNPEELHKDIEERVWPRVQNHYRLRDPKWCRPLTEEEEQIFGEQ